ncbi:MAG TPA: sensor histidine kinase [Pricia antarctica]|uniref:histidine kinase n=2 Tax=root TaxID=1 RepID=A0A831QRT9_9FLAO|nr:sensor histidine kinase [Pricia antarctica]
MSQSTATVLFEDSYGFIWVGTRNGLNKYDGKDFEIFKKSLDGKTGLTNDYILSIYEDNQDLLIGTNQGLTMYDRRLNVANPYPFKGDGKKLETKRFETIIKINKTLWLGTEIDGLFRYHTETGKLKHFSTARNKTKVENGKSNKIIKTVPLDDERILIISTYNVYIINMDMKILNQIQENTEITSAIALDKDKFILGTGNGSLIDLSLSATSKLLTKKKSISPGYVIRSLAQDDNDDLWIGTENNGLFISSLAMDTIRHEEHSVNRPTSISCNSIWTLLKARNGVMWIAPFKSGLSFYDQEYYKFKHIKTNPIKEQSLSNDLVNCIIEDDEGNIWIGTEGGLNYWNRTSNLFQQYTSNDETFGTNAVLSLLETNSDELWAGSWGNGITIFNTVSKKFEIWNTENSFLLSNNIPGLLKDSKDRIWILNFFGGIQLFDQQTNIYQNIPLTSHFNGADINTMYHVFEDKAGNIWIGTLNSGLFKLTENEGTWKSVHYHSNNSRNALSNDFVNTIVQDNNDIIWVGTAGGLNKYMPEEDSFLSISEFDGLRNDAIKGIVVESKKYLWLSTEGGISKFNTSTGETINYDVADGLQSNEFNSNSFLVTKTEEYIFGGVNGLNIFRPDEVEKRKDEPALFISGLKLFNREVIPNDNTGILQKDVSQVKSLTFNHNQSVFTIDFKAITYRHPNRVNYAYFLEGFETDWNYVENTSSATYTNLNPGNYTLRIKSTNSDGIWVNNEVKLNIEIIPPYWQTWWFKLMALVFLLFFLYISYNIKVRTIKKNQNILKRKIEERTTELQLQKEKLLVAKKDLELKNEEIQRFTFAVSHDLKTPLNNIVGIASFIPMEIELKDFPNIQEYLELIDLSCSNMNELIADITKIAQLGKIENDSEVLDINKLLVTVKNLTKAKLDMSNIEVDISENLPNIYGDKKRIIQVFGNLLDNAIKYMGNQTDPIISVTCEEGSETNTFLIRDNGSGMDKNAIEKLFTPFKRFHSGVKGTGLGLYMIKKIVDSHGGTILAESEGKEKGTTFKLIFPKSEIKALADKDITAEVELQVSI